MGSAKLSMPLAVPPAGADLDEFYAGFVGNLVAAWSPATGLRALVAADPDIARLHAPVKAVLRFVAAGGTIGSATTAEDTLVLSTWPLAYEAVKAAIGLSAPAEIRMENVDATAVRAAVTPLFAAIGRPSAAVDAFMAGDGLLMVTPGTDIGAAAYDAAGPAATPDRVTLRVFDAAGGEINPVQFLSDAAAHEGIDKTLHPMLAQLDLDGWIEVVVLDENGGPSAAESYTLYLGDGTTQTGTTDGDGRIFQAGIPAGSWGIDLPNHPSLTIIE